MKYVYIEVKIATAYMSRRLPVNGLSWREPLLPVSAPVLWQ
jgi:hypothetical protein